MEIKHLQQRLRYIARGLTGISQFLESSNKLDTYEYFVSIIESARSLAAEILQEEDPAELLAEAFIQTIIIANILGIDLEEMVKKLLSTVSQLTAEGN
ncbi:MAG: hypothetical protein ACTSVA_01205 [Candidatus Njordarchaeales archaeon]